VLLRLIGKRLRAGVLEEGSLVHEGEHHDRSPIVSIRDP
jgi:hypothetical protein